jgi:hypothetical protein
MSPLLCYIKKKKQREKGPSQVKPVKPHYFDVTSVTDMNELTASYGAHKAWTIAVTQLRNREAKATDRKKKQYLRLMLLNAETQLSLHNQEGTKP